MTARSSFRLALCAGLAVLAASCGGGSGGIPADDNSAPPPATAALITGTAATGSALGNAPVAITDSSGASPCVEASITTSVLGSYTCTLRDGETAPFFVVVTDPTGNTPPLVSISTVTPAAGAALTVNATPLTTAIVAQLASDGNALSVVAARAVDAGALKAVTDNVLAQLAPVLAAIGVPEGYDPFTTSITAATPDNTGNTADMVLDVVKVVTDPATGKLALTTIDNPTPVVLATATAAGGALSAPDPAVSTLSQATQIAARTFNTCFAIPTAQRVLATDTSVPASQGGPSVTQVAADCEDITSDAANAGGIDFLHNGYNAGQLFYSQLTSDAMTGAQFGVPEIVAFYPKNTAATAGSLESRDRAILNIRYVDANGSPGNQIVVAARIEGSSSTERPTDWWLVGNQQPVDVSVNMTVRRTEQLKTSSPRFSTFQTGFIVVVNTKGPGSVGSSGSMTLARVSGPGLPGNGADGTGLVFKTSTETSQAAMDFYNKTGSLTSGLQCDSTAGTFNCPLIWLGRTKGVTGADATTLAAPPNGSNLWAQAGDGVDVSKMVKGARYKVELFYGSDTTTPVYTVYKTLLTDFVAPTSLVNLPWNDIGPQTRVALDPNGSLAGAQATLQLDWVQNPSAQQISQVNAVVDSVGSYGPNQPVPRGATSVVLTNNPVPAFSATGGNRSIKFNYRTQDTTAKSAVYMYN